MCTKDDGKIEQVRWEESGDKEKEKAASATATNNRKNPIRHIVIAMYNFWWDRVIEICSNDVD